jgi:hypothetical protein
MKAKGGGCGKIVGENSGDDGKATQRWDINMYPSGDEVVKTSRQLKILQPEEVDAAMRQFYEPREAVRVLFLICRLHT